MRRDDGFVVERRDEGCVSWITCGRARIFCSDREFDLISGEFKRKVAAGQRNRRSCNSRNDPGRDFEVRVVKLPITAALYQRMRCLHRLCAGLDRPVDSNNGHCSPRECIDAQARCGTLAATWIHESNAQSPGFRIEQILLESEQLRRHRSAKMNDWHRFGGCCPKRRRPTGVHRRLSVHRDRNSIGIVLLAIISAEKTKFGVS